MDHLTSMAVFARVVEAQSFSSAARALGLSKSAVSKHIGRLEDRLGARLLNRTTRRLSLTEMGEVYYRHCARILREAEEADLEVGRLQDEPRGTLRINAPMSFGVLHLAPCLPGFMEAHPHVRVEVSLDDRFVDVVEEGYDLVVRIGNLADSSLIARKLAESRTMIVATPAYWQTNGRPRHPRDLSRHNCLEYAYLSTRNEWRFRSADGGETIAVRISGTLNANNGQILCDAALAGAGVARLPAFIIGSDVAAGRLEAVLTEFAPVPVDIYAVYPHNRHLSAKVRAFIDHYVDWLRQRRQEMPFS